MAKKPVEKPTKEKKAAEPVKEKKADTTANVKNVTLTWFVQPSSGIRIDAGNVKPLNKDGWLQSQIRAGFLEEQ